MPDQLTKQIFIVDDNIHVLSALETTLACKAWKIHGFRSLSDLIRYIQDTDTRPDLILSDYSLTDGDTGIDVVCFVRSHFCSRIPALIISGVVTSKEIDKIEEANLDLLFKSSPPEKLIAEIHARVP